MYTIHVYYTVAGLGRGCIAYAYFTFLFLSRCFLMLTAFFIRWYRSSGRSGAIPLLLRIRRILLPVTNRTWATPWESLKITPAQNKPRSHLHKINQDNISFFQPFAMYIYQVLRFCKNTYMTYCDAPVFFFHQSTLSEWFCFSHVHKIYFKIYLSMVTLNFDL